MLHRSTEKIWHRRSFGGGGGGGIIMNLWYSMEKLIEPNKLNVETFTCHKLTKREKKAL